MSWDHNLPDFYNRPAPRLKCEQPSPQELLRGRRVILILLGILAATGLVFWLLFAFDARREEVSEFTTGNQRVSSAPPWPAGAH
jgi:hypothetical protein